MSRKTIFAILGAIGAALGFFAKDFGLSIDPAAVMGAVVIALVYIFGEAKNDASRIVAQSHKFKDPKFWIAFVAYIVAYVNEAFGLKLPTEMIVTIVTVLLGLLFKKDNG
jgi:tetrahydromethanopterin S-methyltransferase subunit E